VVESKTYFATTTTYNNGDTNFNGKTANFSIQFRSSDPDGAGPETGDIVLDYNTAGTLTDPDTEIFINGQWRTFEVLRVDTMAAGETFEGETVVIIQVAGLPGGANSIAFWPELEPTEAEVAAFPNGRADLTGPNTQAPPYSNICFGPGTRILTPWGAVPIESLKAGTHCVHPDRSPTPIRWIGQQHWSAEDLARAPKLWPVRIAKNALGPGYPRTDLVVSQQHRILISSPELDIRFGSSEMFVPAIWLTDLDGIKTFCPEDGITYYHILFDAHQLVFANGQLAESLLMARQTCDALNREMWEEVRQVFPGINPETVPVAHGQWIACRPVLRKHEFQATLADIARGVMAPPAQSVPA
jgi:hypothetical protein